MKRLPCRAAPGATAFGEIVGAMVDCGAAGTAAQARDAVVRVFGLSSTLACERDPLALAAAERNLAQKTIALDEAIGLLALTQQQAAGARSRVAQAVAAEVARLAPTGSVYSVGAIVGGAIANQGRLLPQGAAARGVAALAVDVANLVEAGVAVAVGCLLRVAPDATFRAALEWGIDPVLRRFAALLALARQCAAGITRGPVGEPRRLLALVQEADMGEEVEALVAVSAVLAAIPPAAPRLPRVLERVNYTMLALVGAAAPAGHDDAAERIRVSAWRDGKQGGDHGDEFKAGAIATRRIGPGIRGAVPEGRTQP